VHLNDGTQEFFTVARGNLYSDVQRVRIGDGGTVRVPITRVIPPATRPADTEWVKRVRIQSRKLTAFWGRPIHLHATVLLPRGYAERTTVRYPTVFTLGHSVPFGFSTDSTRFRTLGRINPVPGTTSTAPGRPTRSRASSRSASSSRRRTSPTATRSTRRTTARTATPWSRR
jgi:hypothetical protein